MSVVQVVEVTAQALVENVGATESQGAIRAHAEAGSVDGTGLSWLVELELVVGGNVTCSALAVEEDTIGQGQVEHAGSLACHHLRGHGRC